jgi:YHS domain-containing protein
MKATLSLITLLSLSALAAAPATKPAKTHLNLDKNNLAIQGHDPVAYFTDHRAVKGHPQLRLTHQGATYLFASQDHATLFQKDPDKYTPQFGGFCAYAVSKGKTANIDPDAFQIVGNRLLLQYSKSIRDTFSKDTAGNLKKADANWPTLVEEHGK